MLIIPKIPQIVWEKRNVSEDYTVKINGRSCEVRSARVSAMPFNRTWPGKQRDISQSEISSFITFSSDEPVTLEIECNRSDAEGKKALVRPFSKNYALTQNGRCVTLEMSENGFAVVELEDEHHCLHIFNNPVKEFERKAEATYYFGPGVHCPGLVRLKSGDSVYIDEGAVVYGSFFGENVENIDIYGYGCVDGSYEERLYEHCYEKFTKGNIKFYESRNIRIEGVTLLNSAIWVVNLFACENVTVDGIKIIGQWRYNTDGIDIVNSGNINVRNCFIRVFDDVITIKGIEKYKERSVRDLVIEGCVLWCGWGRTCEIGIEAAAPEYDNIIFRNCDLIHNSAAALDIRNGNFADIHDIVFEDIRVEFSKHAMPEIGQRSDDQVYDPSSFDYWMPALIWTDNFKFLPMDGDDRPGTIHDVIFKNIIVYKDKELPAPTVHFLNSFPESEHYNFIVDGLYINGKRVKSFTELNYMKAPNVKNVELK